MGITITREPTTRAVYNQSRGPVARLRRRLLHALMALLATAAVLGVASSCMFLTTASEAINLIFEPFSLLLMPGLIVALTISNLHGHLPRHGYHVQETHDFSTNQVLALAAAFYFCFFFAVFSWWSQRRRSRRS